MASNPGHQRIISLARELSGAKVVLSAIQDLKVIQDERIHEQGKDANGNLLGKNRDGRYSEAYAKFRARKGRQSQRVKLEFRGDLRRGYVVTVLGRHEYGFTFLNPELAARADHLEELYQTDIFCLSNEEKKDLVKLIQEHIKRFIQ